jgi:neopullulanase
MRRGVAGALIALALAGERGLAQAPTVEKVEPPNWWSGHSINPVRVLVRGRNLAGARMQCARG